MKEFYIFCAKVFTGCLLLQTSLIMFTMEKYPLLFLLLGGLVLCNWKWISKVVRLADGRRQTAEPELDTQHSTLSTPEGETGGKNGYD